MGLQYLTDRPELFRDREKIFDSIRSRRITAEQLQSSDLYHKIADRVDMLPLFFPQDKMDYAKIRHRGLYFLRKKVTLSTGKEEILYDKLKK